MAYIFKKTPDEHNAHDITSVTISVAHNEVSLDALLEVFTEFLKACSWAVDGTLQVVPDEEEEVPL
jgi:hypothetical protein